MPYFEELKNIVQNYLPEEKITALESAYLFAQKAHENQIRSSGEPYISHPVAVAIILAKMQLDHETLIAALLHDVIEDTLISYQDVNQKFGTAVAELVEGVSKLDRLKFRDRKEAQAENFRKMVMAMVQDIRVIFIKLADRMHNMQTIKSLRPNKQKRIAQETLEIYSPLAHRLGINQLKMELERLSFEALNPYRYKIISKAVNVVRHYRTQYVFKTIHEIRSRLNQLSIQNEIVIHQKNIYSIYLKMKQKEQHFRSILDICSFRIIVETIDDCYRVLGQIHNLYKPRIGYFKDYIAIPKANGYQALHSSLVGIDGVPIEIFILTKEMAKMADLGIITTWIQQNEYPSEDQKTNAAQIKIEHWVQSLIELQQSAGNSVEFIEEVKSDLFPRHIYVFTPNGKIVELPLGSTALDFAYAVHTDIGNHCIGAKINNTSYSLSAPLSNGQTIEILTSENHLPKEKWLNYVITPTARTKIKQSLKKTNRKDTINLGKLLLKQKLEAYHYPFETFISLNKLLNALNLTDSEDLLFKIGTNKLSLGQIFSTYKKLNPNFHKIHSKLSPILIHGECSSMIKFCTECYPIPNDKIIAYLQTETGLLIHREKANHDFTHAKTQKKVLVNWNKEKIETELFSTKMAITLLNKRDIFSHLITTIKSENAKIQSVQKSEIDLHIFYISITILVKNNKHLDHVIKKVENLPNIIQIERI